MTRNPNFTWDGTPVEHLILPRSPVRKSAHLSRAPATASTLACTACELRGKCKAPVPPSFPSSRSSSFAVLATAPTRLDDRKGVPFVSRGGQIIRKLFSEAGMDPDEGTWLNTVACATDSPSPDQRSTCRHNLIGGLHAANTRYVLLCGAVATGAWRPGVKVTRARGRWFIWWEQEEDNLPGSDSTRRGWWVMPTYHPAAILEQPNLRGELREDITKFVDVVKDNKIPVPSLTCVECGEPQTRWDVAGVGWCDSCWARRLKNHAVSVGRGRRKVHPDQAAFKF